MHHSPATGSSGVFGGVWAWLALALLIVCVRGLFIDLMDIDAAQYASIAMEMLQNGHWLQVRYHHLDYLDKPPLLFWSSALSFAAFGLHTWAYKLPSGLAVLAGVYATFRFCLLFYPRSVARNAAFILAASAGVVVMCNDVRTDSLLLGMTALATWQLAAYLTPSPDRQRGDAQHLILAGFFIGFAMLAKGPIGLVVPTFAVATQLALHRDWRRLLEWRWLLCLGVVVAVLLPMCWGLYQQFDLQPGTLVNNRTTRSGLRFFFWDQSFGRITGTSAWKNDTSPLFFVHTFLWAFLPWSWLFVGAFWQRIVDVVHRPRRLTSGDEAFSLGGFGLTFVALSLSHYKLPHYIFVVLPWAAVLAARWLAVRRGVHSDRVTLGRGWWLGQYALFAMLGGVLVWLLRGVFPTGSVPVWSVVTMLFGSVLVMCWREPFPVSTDVLVQRSAIVAVAVAFVLNFHFYPHLLRYQATSTLPRIARTANIPMEKLAFYRRHGDAMNFSARRVLPELTTPQEVRDSAAATGPIWLYVDSVGRMQLDSAGVVYAEAAATQHFAVARLSVEFLTATTRSHALQSVYLLRIPAQKER